MTSNLTITIASVPDRDEVVAELWADDEQVAELSQDRAELTLQLYRPPGKYWQFSYDEFLTAVSEMKRKLVGGE